MKTNLETTRNETENPNVIRVTETYEMPRYTGRKWGDNSWLCEDTIRDIKEACPIWVGARDYKSLSNFYLDEDELTGNLDEDLKLFQKKIDEKLGEGKYEAYVLGAYVHSGTSFSLTKNGDRRCRFDSGNLGFIGVPKEGWYASTKEIVENLDAVWNGEFIDYRVIDELTDEEVDGIVTANWDEAREFEKKALEKWGVDFDKIEIQF